MPNYNITMSREFLKDLSLLPPAVYPRAIRAAERILENPWAKELHPEKIRRAESGIYSCRVDKSYRIIWKHIKPDDVVLCLVDKHDKAYQRAERKSFTLSDGVVRIADILQVGAQVSTADDGLFSWLRQGRTKPGALFAGYLDKELLEMGVPSEVLPNLRALDNVNQMDLVERLLPPDVYNRLLEIVLGIVDRPVVPDQELRRSLKRYQGGDDLHRFVDSEEFKRALEGSMEDWMIFLAPHQRRLVRRNYNGPARIKGVAGSGKTVVAIHRARLLAKIALKQQQKVLFLTYGSRLPSVVKHLLKCLAGDRAPELEAVECITIHQWCYRFLAKHGQKPNIDRQALDDALKQAITQTQCRYPKLQIWSRLPSFFSDEICYAIKGHAIKSLDEYLALDRGGRGTPLNETQRRAIFEVYEAYQTYLDDRGLCDFDDYILNALHLIELGHGPDQYMAAVVDEIQDLSETVMRLIRSIIPSGPNDLFLVGDGLQRIYPGGYVLSHLDINIVGRSMLLRKNYRNTQEILRAAHAMMMGGTFDDMDDTESEVPEPEFSVRRGQIPVLRCFDSPAEELHWIRDKVLQLTSEQGYAVQDVALLYRWRKPYQDLIYQHLAPRFEVVEIERDVATYFGSGIKHTTFHSAKGLEFKVVFVIGVTDGHLVPRDDWTLEDEELENYLARERRLLYVAMTRARDLLYLTCSRGQPSRFLANVPTEYLQREWK